MKEVPFEDFIPNWSSGIEEEDEEADKDTRRTKMIAALMAAAAGAGTDPTVPPRGQSMSRPREK